jgi:hypothetical protein
MIVNGDHQPPAEDSRSSIYACTELLGGAPLYAPRCQIGVCAVEPAQSKPERGGRTLSFRNPLLSGTMLRAVLGPAISAKVIEALDALYKSADLPITRLSQGGGHHCQKEGKCIGGQTRSPSVWRGKAGPALYSGNDTPSGNDPAAGHAADRVAES